MCAQCMQGVADRFNDNVFVKLAISVKRLPYIAHMPHLAVRRRRLKARSIMTGPILPMPPLVSPARLEAMLAHNATWQIWPVSNSASAARTIAAGGGGGTADNALAAAAACDSVPAATILGFVERSQVERLLQLYDALQASGRVPACVGGGDSCPRQEQLVVSLHGGDAHYPPAPGVTEGSLMTTRKSLDGQSQQAWQQRGEESLLSAVQKGHEVGPTEVVELGGRLTPGSRTLRRTITDISEGALSYATPTTDKLTFRPYLGQHAEGDEEVEAGDDGSEDGGADARARAAPIPWGRVESTDEDKDQEFGGPMVRHGSSAPSRSSGALQAALSLKWGLEPQRAVAMSDGASVGEGSTGSEAVPEVVLAQLDQLMPDGESEGAGLVSENLRRLPRLQTMRQRYQSPFFGDNALSESSFSSNATDVGEGESPVMLEGPMSSGELTPRFSRVCAPRRTSVPARHSFGTRGSADCPAEPLLAAVQAQPSALDVPECSPRSPYRLEQAPSPSPSLQRRTPGCGSSTDGAPTHLRRPRSRLQGSAAAPGTSLRFSGHLIDLGSLSRRPGLCIEPDLSIERVFQLFNGMACRYLPVVDSAGMLLGIVTRQQMVKCQWSLDHGLLHPPAI